MRENLVLIAFGMLGLLCGVLFAWLVTRAFRLREPKRMTRQEIRYGFTPEEAERRLDELDRREAAHALTEKR